jgi:HTH-type transcriptional repressor of NAD biosynthesis genes
VEEYISQKKSKCLKVVLYGPESSGKTTLAIQLAQYYKTKYVPEFARQFLQNKWDLKNEICDIDDLIKIAFGQMKSENTLTDNSKKILFCDTNILVTKIWSESHYDGFCPKLIKELVKIYHYDLYILTQVDIPWIKDDLRDRPNNRNEMFDIFKAELDNKKLNYLIVNGSKNKRLKMAVKFIDSYINKLNKNH